MTVLLPLLVLLARNPAAEAAAQDARRLEHLYGEVAASYDSSRGGFVTHDQAPNESAIELAYALGREQGDPLWTARANRTVAWMHALYDSAGGGFFYRLKDVDPMQQTFTKSTSDNAQRLENLIDAWQRGGVEAERGMASRVADYMDRVLADGRGGFVAGQVGDRGLVPEANGQAIRAWLRWAASTADPHVRDFALKSLDRVWETCWLEGMGLMRPDEFGHASGAPRLVDQAEMGRAFVLGAHLAGREADLDRARTLGNLVLANFEDTEKGGFGEDATPHGDKGKTHHGGRKFDQNACAVRFLAELASISGKNDYRDAARRAATSFDKNLGHAGPDAAPWALALRALKVPDLPARPKWKDAEKKGGSEKPKVFRPTAGR
jgi:uncharacterized protein YyaL (SSP411 family)